MPPCGVQQEKAQGAAERVGAVHRRDRERRSAGPHGSNGAACPSSSSAMISRGFCGRCRRSPSSHISTPRARNSSRSRALEADAVASGRDFSSDPRFVKAVAEKTWFGPVYFRRGSEPYMTIAVAHAGHEPGVTVAEVNLKLIWDVITQHPRRREGLCLYRRRAEAALSPIRT